MKTVIVPAIGTPAIFEKCSVIADLFPREFINYIFVDIRPIPDNYNDLITLKRDGRNNGLFTDSFCEAVGKFSDASENRSAITDHIYGDSIPVFRNYMEHRSGDIVLFDQAQWMNHPHFKQGDIFKLLIRCGSDIIYIANSANETSGKTVRLSSEMIGTSPAMRASVFQKVYKNNQPYATSIHAEVESADEAGEYRSVGQMLNELGAMAQGDEILIRQVSGLSRYFMKQSTIERMLSESNRGLLWLRK